MINQFASLAFAALAALPCAMHLAIAAGAPLGRYTVGGRFPDRLPPAWRGLALVQAGLLVGMALVVLARGGVIAPVLPGVLFWPAALLALLTFIANAATPSIPERRLWAPVTFAMLVAVLATGLL